MYNKEIINTLIKTVKHYNGIGKKDELSAIIQKTFVLTRDRSVFSNQWFAIRFCKANTPSFGNTVLSLSSLQKYDSIPFIVCLVTPAENNLLLANTTFLKKISHSSQELRVDNIKGSFNGSDIMKSFEGIENQPENFEFLFTSHENYTFSENLVRLVEATNHIHPTGHRFCPSDAEKDCIFDSVDRTISFLGSPNYQLLNEDLNQRVQHVASEIVIASFIDNVNLRGRIIEYLVTEEGSLHQTLIQALHTGQPLPAIFTSDKLGDYERVFDRYLTETDIKTKILFLFSNPKGYNIDKFLQFLAEETSVYLVFIIAIDQNQKISTRLCSPLNIQLLSGTRIIHHWAGRNSRGVTQYDGACFEQIINHFDPTVDREAALHFIKVCLSDDPASSL